ncbi:MAG: glycosyltransferase, partial [Woeseia sp.]
HQAGSRTIDIARETYRSAGVEAQVDEFINDMAAAYGWADLVICRAGALTVAEICAVGLPAIFVPYPAAVDDHQTANARGLVDVDAAIIIQEAELTPATLAAVVAQWCANREQLVERAEAARSLARNDSLEVITGLCLKLAEAAA